MTFPADQGQDPGVHEHAHAYGHGRASAGTRALAVALGLIVAFAVVEVVAGLAASSLALLADAGHMVGDAGSLALALLAAWAAGRPATAQRSFGFRRAEILAALANGVALVAIAIWIFVEAFDRLGDPPEPLGGWMLAVGVAGLAVNVAAAAVIHRSGSESLNVRAALRHVLADLLGSVGVIVAGVLVLATGWAYADPLVSLAIALLVLASSWTVLRDSVGILLEAAPRDLDVGVVGAAMAAVEGVREVHDLHVWTITSGFPALSAHVLVAPGADCHAIREQLDELLRARFALHHTTLQVEHAVPATVELSRQLRT
ncbi:MAG TPA: cation diffusion facilitator family transporter [Gaiellaceae bacterium]|nr:cation diffusion facilitator family transporter [Gaiellaceae bacterium]